MTAKTKKPAAKPAAPVPAVVSAGISNGTPDFVKKQMVEEARAKLAKNKGKVRKPSIAAVSKPIKPAKTAKKEKTAKKDGPRIKGWKPLPAKKFLPTVAGKKITLLVKSNPKHGKSAKRFNLYKNGMSVEAAVKAGVLPLDLQWDSSAHHRGGAFIAIK